MRMRTAGQRLRTRRGRMTRPLPRGLARVSAVAMIVVAAGVTAGSAPAASQQAASLRLAYTCTFPSGQQPVTVQVTGTFPSAVTAGQAIQPAGTAIAVTLPEAFLTRLTWPSGTTVTMTAGLSTQVTAGASRTAAIWRNYQAPATAVPPSAPLTLTAAGAAPSVKGTTAGPITIAASGLSLLLAAHAADGHPLSPPSVQVTCVPGAGQDTTLARIAVAGPPPSKAAASPADNPAKCIPFPKGLKLNPRFPLPKPPPGSRLSHSPTPACAYSAGFTNARKLNEAALVGPGLADLKIGIATYAKFGSAYTYIQTRAAGQLEYHGLPELPPARATLLAFGFMPVSATIQLSEIGSLSIALLSCTPGSKPCPNSPPEIAYFYGLVSLHIYDVSVNGTPLNVGPHCQTATPFELALTGVPPAYDVSLIQGVLTGTVNIPPFKGCANGTDNLDSIFTSSVSGPGNFAKITQAPLCTPKQNFGCPPVKPIPKH
jgi:hypothetical protein